MTAGRVLLVSVSAQRYGSERSLLTLARGLVRRGWAVTVVVPSAGPLVDDLAAAGADVVARPVGLFRRSFGVVEWIRFAARDLPRAAIATARLARRVDVVHVNTSVTLGAAVGARLARRPLVWHVRESYEGAPALWRAYGRVMRAIATVLVANSASTASACGASVVVHNGLDLGPVPPLPNGHGVVAVGRLAPGKGHDVLIDAVALLRARGVDLEATIAGDAFPGAEEVGEELARQIERCGVGDLVRLAGFVDDVQALLDRHQIFVLASRRPEGFGNSLLEAMARGLACVATDVGGPKEIVRHGENGLLVPPDDPRALADALEALAGDAPLRARLGMAAAADVRERFGADALVERVLDVYAEVRR